MKKTIFFLLLATSALSADLAKHNTFLENSIEPKLVVNNVILTKVNGNTISVVDLMKKMDLLFHRSYPELIGSKPARHQFYQGSWRHILEDLINTELILADAAKKEVAISDGEIREEMEERFGPNMMVTLDEIGITYDEAWKLIKTELIVRRMTWFHVNSKAIQSVSPQMIRQAYREYCSENPPSEEWVYQVVSIRSSDDDEGNNFAIDAYNQLAIEETDLDSMSVSLQDLSKEYTHSSLQISNVYQTDSTEISHSHKSVLEALEIGEYSKPIPQTSRFDKKVVHRIFYLKNHTTKDVPSFDEMSNRLKDELLQLEAAKASQNYFGKLRRFYGYDEQKMKEMIADNFQPFELL